MFNYLDHRLSLFLSKLNQTSLSLQTLFQFHSLILTSGNSNDLFIASKLISQYASLHKPSLSTRLFHQVCPKDVFLWNSVIKSHFSNGNHEKALDLFAQMRSSGFAPNRFTLPMVAVACADLLVVRHGKCIHGLASKLGTCSREASFGSSLVYMYCKFGEMRDAGEVFDEIISPDVVAWTALIIGYVQNGESKRGLKCLSEMLIRSGSNLDRPNFRTLQGGLQACANLGALCSGKYLQSFAIKTGISCSDEVKSSILSMYSKCGTPLEAHKSFLETEKRDIVSWMLVISVYSRLGLTGQCVNLFHKMLISGVCPDEMVISCMLWGFGNSASVLLGKAFHGLIITQGYSINEIVHNALVSMYCKFGLVNFVEKLFRRNLRWTKELCGAMIFVYNKIGESSKCIDLFREMQYRGIEPDSETLVNLISSCSQLGVTNIGKSFHCYVIKYLIQENLSVTNSLVDMYGKSGHLSLARRIFLRSQRDIVTWNTMMSCHIHNKDFSEAISLFDEMISTKKFGPNQATFVIVLSACSHLVSLEKGREVHKLVKETGVEINLPLATALVDMYSKCGWVDQSRNLFDSTRHKDVVMWNVMISGYGTNGSAESAIDLFRDMENHSGVKPNELTFLALLSACAHSGLVEEGKYLFNRMKDYYSLSPDLKHFTCMVDLLGRSGNLLEAEDLVLSMPVCPDGGVWGSLLSSCLKHKESEKGVRIAKLAIESDPRNEGYYVTLSNLYSSSGKWEEAEEARRMMREKGVDKEAGWSCGLN